MISTDKNSQFAGRPDVPLIAAIRFFAARGLRSFRRPRAPRRLQLVETLPLGGKRQLILVTCDGRDFLIGAGADTVSTIAPVTLSAGSGDSYAGDQVAIHERGLLQ